MAVGLSVAVSGLAPLGQRMDRVKQLRPELARVVQRTGFRAERELRQCYKKAKQFPLAWRARLAASVTSRFNANRLRSEFGSNFKHARQMEKRGVKREVRAGMIGTPGQVMAFEKQGKEGGETKFRAGPFDLVIAKRKPAKCVPLVLKKITPIFKQEVFAATRKAVAD